VTTRNTEFTVHPALGGLDISSDPTVLDPNFLVVADNIEYREGGQRKRRPGFRVYSTATGSTGANLGTPMVSGTASVRAIQDFWKYGASLTPVQHYVSVTGASIFASTGNGKWTALTATSSFGVDSNRQTNITLAGDFAVISDGVSAPVAYDQTALLSTALVQPTTGSLWPKFTHSSYHLNRLFYQGISTAPSRVDYTAAGNIFDSTGADTGNFPVGTGDGDQVMALSKPFYASLYVFKGPQFGSVWQLSGATPALFSMVQVSQGAPILNPRALVTTPTDIYWLSQYGVHSLQTTVKFGNVEEAFLSLPIQRLWRDRLINRAKLSESWGFWHPQRNIVGWAVQPQGELKQHWFLCYNYALSDPKPGGKKFWSIWKMSGFATLCGAVQLVTALGTAQSGSPHLYIGGDTGLVYEGDQDVQDTDYVDAGSAYTVDIRTPTITRFKLSKGMSVPETQEKQFLGITTYFNPKGSGASAAMTITVDRRTQSKTVSFTGIGATLT